ncbi:nitrogen fixation protein NifM [Motiliproteus sp. SC1-56]|uniref:nitrogen fixation protein NifM n=1 Tax=Motiliproteus sp. SC1-56 TaxID=2799565 RepID=UPI001A8CB9D9|nr:nitrogen fixation protein NifM [Motiliproteus sp. SC1-56]
MTDPLTAYYRLRAAKSYFDAAPDALDPRQQAWLEGTVARQLELEKRVLGSETAATVIVSDERLRAALEEVRGRFPSDEAFMEDLERMGLSLPALSNLLERQLRVELALERQAASVDPVSNVEARAYYDAHPARFRRPEQRQARHILVTVNPAYPENQRAAVVARLERIREEVAAAPTRFDTLARRHSECPTALKGGEMGWLPRGQLFPAIDAVLFALDVDRVSAPIETEVGLHLVQCTAIRPETLRPFDEVAPVVIEKLTAAARQQAQRDWMRGLT